MIKFFRHIRKSLLSENRISRYLLYAIGEILLVIIGILMALQINNLNEERKNENKIKSILKEIQEDLHLDIQRSKEIITYDNIQDSLVRRVEQDLFTFEDYKNALGNLYIISDIEHMKIHTTGYDNLMRLIDIIPYQIKPVVRPLKNIYVDIKYEVDKVDQRGDVITDQFLDDMAQSKYWSHNYWNGQINDSMINFFVEDDFYKNAANKYKFAIRRQRRAAINFVEHAIRMSTDISKILGNGHELPEYFPDDLFFLSKEQMTELVGTYRIIRIGNENIQHSDIRSRVYHAKIDDNRLILREGIGENVFSFYPLSKDQFASTLWFLYDRNPRYTEKIEIKRDDDNRIEGFLHSNINGSREAIKIE